MPELRAIALAHQPELMALMERIYPPVYAHYWKPGGQAWYLGGNYGHERLARELADPNARYDFVLGDDGAPVGILRAVARLGPDYEPDPRSVKLHRIYLDPAVQGRGLGAACVRAVVEWAGALGATRVWLEAMARQPAALAFYARQGFRELGRYTLAAEPMREEMRPMVRLVREL